MTDGLQVIGVGMHRTGSVSVKSALERLGFGPCYHGLEALRRASDGDFWLAAHETEGAVDWSVLFDGYRSTLDWPTIAFWEQLAAAYPDAKIILTTRDPESWWPSHARMFQVGMEFDQELTDEQRRWAQASGFGRMQVALATIVMAAFDGRVDDEAHCRQVFEEHYDCVRRTVPADRLLEYRVEQGWAPLCRFLGVDVPDEPFPRRNVGDDLRDNIHTAMRHAQAATGDATWR